MAVRDLALVGTGLIGASVGLAARAAGVRRVLGWDPDPRARETALESGAVHGSCERLEEALAGAELAVVAVPVAVLAEQVSRTLQASAETCTVTDVGSIKGLVCERVIDRERFIGGHPIAGSEARGAEHASAELFRGATWFLTPVAETRPERYRRVMGFVSAIGAVPVAVEPRAHDRLVALISHLPHALANLLLNHAGAILVDGHEPLNVAGGSLRDMTRVAGANARIWVDIFMENAEELQAALGEHRRRVEELESALAQRDAGYLARWIGEAAAKRRTLLETAYPDAGALFRLDVHVPDRPGVFAGITQALAIEGINIEDLEVHHVSPERGGTLGILVTGEESAQQANDLLEAQGYSVITGPAFPEG